MSIDLYYFSATGNTLHVAKELQKRLEGSRLLPIVGLLSRHSIKAEATLIGIISPLHGMTLPVPTEAFLRKLDPLRSSYIFAVTTRGGTISKGFARMNARDRVGELLHEHMAHQVLASSLAYEMETGKVELKDPPPTSTFRAAYFDGVKYPIQACLYLAHRARIYIIKAIVDYWLAKSRGDIKSRMVKFGKFLIDFTSGGLSPAMAAGAEELAKAKSFRRFPLFWQVFLWSWGGFLFKDRLDDEYRELAQETGVPVSEIPIALSAFDKLFPLDDGWFREPANDSRTVAILMPAAMRGIGAYPRLLCKGIKEYGELGLKDDTERRLQSGHNSGARLLDCPDTNLTK